MKAPALRPLSFEMKKKLKEKKELHRKLRVEQFDTEEVEIFQKSEMTLNQTCEIDPDLNITQQMRLNLDSQKSNSQKSHAYSVPQLSKKTSRHIQQPSNSNLLLVPTDPRYLTNQMKWVIANRQIQNPPFSRAPCPQLIKQINDKKLVDDLQNTPKTAPILYPRPNISSSLKSMLNPPRPQPSFSSSSYRQGNWEILEKKFRT
jgi:hypothetical protein